MKAVAYTFVFVVLALVGIYYYVMLTALHDNMVQLRTDIEAAEQIEQERPGLIDCLVDGSQDSVDCGGVQYRETFPIGE